MSESQNKFKLFFSISGALLIQLCLGSTYAWSTFVRPLQTQCEIDGITAQWVFGIRTAAFALSMIPVGKILSPNNLSKIAGAGGLLFAAGHILPYFAPKNPIILILGMGLFVGLAMSGGYLSALRICASAIPERKGLLIGLAVAAFALGAILTSNLGAYLLNNNILVVNVFLFIGIAYGLIQLVTALLLFIEDRKTTSVSSHDDQQDKNSSVIKGIASGCFVGKISANFGGLMVIGNMVPISTALNHEPTVGISGIAAFSIGNAIGRIIWGWLFDRFGKPIIICSLATMSAFLIALERFGINQNFFILCTFGVGFSFGAPFVLYASFLTLLYGANILQRLYPWVFTAHGFAAVLGAPLGAWILNYTGNATWLLWIAAIVALIGLVGFHLLVAHFEKKSTTTN